MTDDDRQRLESAARALFTLHDGVVKLSTLLAADISGKQAAALKARGVLERPRGGWYVDPALPWQAKCAIRVGGVLARVSAVDSFGLPMPNLGGRRVHRPRTGEQRATSASSGPKALRRPGRGP